MNDREEILNRLRAHERPANRPPAWRSGRHFDDLATRFAQSLSAVDGEVHRANSLDAAIDLLGGILTDLDARRIAVNAEPPLDILDLASLWPALEWLRASEASEQDLRDFCASADVGISGADAALAETGTVVLSSGPGRSRLVTLLPPTHLALVPESCLTPDIFSWTAARGGDMPASITLVSGPSKTADIEQTLAIGVHGPKRFIAVLYRDR